MSLTKNPNVNKWVDEMVALTKPDKVVWIDGSQAQLDALTDEVCALPEGNRDVSSQRGKAPWMPLS